MKRNIFLTGSVLFACAVNAQAGVITHYDVDFNSPVHTPGSTPTTGSGADTPTKIGFGSPTVKEQFGALDDQPLVFNSTGNTAPYLYDQIGFRLGRGYDNYRFEYDILASNLIGSEYEMTLLLDTPTVQNVYLRPNGQIGLTGRILSPPPAAAYFEEDSILKFVIDVDLAASRWNIAVNGSHITSSTFQSSGGDIDNFRFSLGKKGFNSPRNDDVYVALDNLKVTSFVDGPDPVPVSEPGAFVLFGMALLGLFSKKRLRTRQTA
ncbi:PEP-CTERM sorting domain-containing protein [Hahella sp. HN01]|uniref:PEP-CTERM sorting domain-containing protein n=1 Tax=Hahella sp. HN01 TaxID=2847262 RepID=UPI001C1EF71D|nr:PEP-CTERM sorting domain-containing protein [Hahella sp. HN01]MBU6953194.1 PEP-CTERM sorting domain-containing protein [Hahella sp. HN01]